MKKLLSILLIFVLLLTLAACGGGGSASSDDTGSSGGKGNKHKDDEETATGEIGSLFTDMETPKAKKLKDDEAEPLQSAVAAFLDAYARLDPAAGEYLLGSGQETALSYDGAAGIIAAGLSYTIGDAYSYGDAYYVETEITVPDFGAVYDALLEELGDRVAKMSGEEIGARFEKRLAEASDYADFSVPCYLYLQQPAPGSGAQEAVIRIAMGSEFSNAICGGAQAYFDRLLAEALEQARDAD